MNEEWKDIEGFEGKYQVSNLGRVRSIPRDTNNQFYEGTVLKPLKTCGYYRVCLYSEGVKKFFLVHRLVAKAFMPNPEGLPCINHIDEDKTNNCVNNLEFCTHKYNNNYGSRNQRFAETQRNTKPSRKKTYQLTLDGKLIQVFQSANDAARKTGFSRGHIAACCRGNTKLKTYKGFKWSYEPPNPQQAQ